MRIWLVEIGEPLPIDHEKRRLWRIGLLAEALLARGHHVTWWASTFDHSHKKHRYHGDTVIGVTDRYLIRLLYGISYKKNVSVRRLLNHWSVGQKLFKFALKEPKPDIIHCCLPTLDNCAAATRFGAKYHIPVVIDIRDMWPEIMVDVLPTWAAPLARLLLTPMFKSVQNSCACATAISGSTGAFVEKGLAYAKRPRTVFDRDFPFGYPEEVPDQQVLSLGYEFWRQFGITPEDKRFIVCFIGALSPRMELDVLIRTAHQVRRLGKNILFVICGKGEQAEQCRIWANDADNIVLPGWIGAAEIWALMQMASVGIIPYPSIPDFSASIPNKAVEYLAGRLPIISGVKGVLEKLLLDNGCGLTYENQNHHHLTSLLCELFDNPERLSVMSDNAYQLFKRKFTAKKVYTDMSEHLERIAKHPPKVMHHEGG